MPFSIMLFGAALRKTNTGWEFTSEATLEDFIWDNLQSLLNLTPLKRQHFEQGEYCDILAINNQKQLTILELKNVEDRYIVQQLTRYYDNLINAKPFEKQIDYSLPVKLIAFAPSFHRHNLTDRQYNSLNIELLRYKIVCINDNFQMQLMNDSMMIMRSIPIDYREIDVTDISVDVPAAPQKLLDWLGCSNHESQQAILKMRSLILSFDNRIKEEIPSKNVIIYKGKGKAIAEFFFWKKINKPVIFLWLPTPSSILFENKKQVLGRMRLWMNDNSVTHAGHVSEGVGRMKLQSEWDSMPSQQRPRNLLHSLSYKSFSPVKISFYENLVSTPTNLECLVNLALNKWFMRI